MILFSKNGSFSQRIILFGAPEKDAVEENQNFRSNFLLVKKIKEGECAPRQLYKESREIFSQEFKKMEKKTVFMSFFSRTLKKRIILCKDVNLPSTV